MIRNKDEYLTAREVAEKVGFNDASYVRRLIIQKKLKAIKIGGLWLINLKDVKHLKRRRYRSE